MGISLNIVGDNAADFGDNLKGFIGLLASSPNKAVAAEVVFDSDPTTAGVIAEVGPNPPAGGEAPKRRGRPAKPPVTIEATAEPAKVEGVATGEPDPTAGADAAPPTASGGTTEAVAAKTVKPTIDEARAALKAVAALPNGQELTYSVLTEMGVKTLTEAYIKDAERLMALCAAKMPVVAA